MSGHAGACPCRNLVDHGECPRCICGYDDTDYTFITTEGGPHDD